MGKSEGSDTLFMAVLHRHNSQTYAWSYSVNRMRYLLRLQLVEFSSTIYPVTTRLRENSGGTDRNFVTIRALTILSKYKGSGSLNSSFHYCIHKLVSKHDI